MRLLIALMVVVGMAQAQTYSITVYVPPPATYVFTADTMSMKRLGYVLDYSRGLVLTNDGRDLVAVKKLESKPRAEKKIELQEASKRSADFADILSQAEWRFADTKAADKYITDWFIKSWEEYCAQVSKDTVWVMAKEPRVWTDGKFIREDWFVRGTRTPTFEGFLDYLKRRKK